MPRSFAPLLWLCALVLFGAMMLGLPRAALAEGRHALVIGIDRYDRLTHLQKARNNARAMFQALEAAGFRATLLLDTDQIGFLQAIADFSAQIAPGDEAVVYFAGHGVEIDGKNYLLPSDTPAADPGAEIVLTSRSVAVDTLVDALHRRGARLSLLILDACRDNPFPRRGTRTIGGTRGLAQASPPEGTYILYSAGERETALDRLSDADPNPNSVFTRALLPLISVPGLPLRDMSTQVRREVRAMAASINHTQFPAVYDQLDGNFSFTKGDGPPPALPDPCATARADWPSVEQAGSAAALRAYIAAYPGCRVQVALAQEKLASLGAAAPPDAPLPAPPSQDKVALPSDCKLAAREWASVTRSDLAAVRAFAARWVNCPTYGKYAQAIAMTGAARANAAPLAQTTGQAAVAANPSAPRAPAPPAQAVVPQPTTAAPVDTTAPRVCRLAEAELQTLDRADRDQVQRFATRWAACTAAVAEARADPATCRGVSAAWGALDLYDKAAVQGFVDRFPDCVTLSYMAKDRIRAMDAVAAKPQTASKLDPNSCLDARRAWAAVDQSSRLSLESYLVFHPACAPFSAMAQTRLSELAVAPSGSGSGAGSGTCVGASAAWGAVDRDSLRAVQDFLARYPDCAPHSGTARTRISFLNTRATRSGPVVLTEPLAQATDYSIRQIAQIRLTLNAGAVLPSTIRQENLRSLDLAKLGLFAKSGLRDYLKTAFDKTEADPQLTKSVVTHILAQPRTQGDIAPNLMATTLFQPERSGDWLSGMEGGQCRVLSPAVGVTDPLVHMMPAVIGSATPGATGNAMNWLIAWPMPFVPGRDVIADVDGRRFGLDRSPDGSNIILPRTADGKYVDSALTEAMRRGTTLTLTGPNQETGEPVSFTFSLKGFTAAFNQMADLCKRPQLRAWID